MRVIFMGTTQFSKRVLNQLIQNNYNIVAVVTQPDRPFGRKRILKASVVKELAQALHIPILQPIKIKDHVQEILDYHPDLIVTCAYGQLVPRAIIDYPRYRCLNIHASILPHYRGGAPIHWAIINGETQTGITLMLMDEGMDSGAMIAKRFVEILPDDTMGHVEEKLMAVAEAAIDHDLPLYLTGVLKPVAQDEAQASFAYTIKRSDEFVSFARNAKVVYNHIRGLIPWPVGYGIVDNVNVKLHQVQLIPKEHDHEPGLITEITAAGMHVACLEGILVVSRLQLAGKPVLSSQDFMNGAGKNWKGKVFK